MEVKEPSNHKVVPDRNLPKISPPEFTKSGSVGLASSSSAVDSVNVDRAQKSQSLNFARTQANELISVTNIASQATSDIEELIKGISGIVEQVHTKNFSEPQKAILEDEANDLVKEIQHIAKNTAVHGVHPLLGDKIKLDVEEKIGKTLEFILPDDARDSFGIGRISFSHKDAIIRTIANVEEARTRINNLKNSVGDVSSQVKETVDTIDVAAQNGEATQSTIRDLDQALKLAGETGLTISKHPDTALGSVGRLDNRALDLLK